MLIAPKWLKLWTSNLTGMLPGAIQTTPLKNFVKRGVARITWPPNFLGVQNFQIFKLVQQAHSSWNRRPSDRFNNHISSFYWLTVRSATPNCEKWQWKSSWRKVSEMGRADYKTNKPGQMSRARRAGQGLETNLLKSAGLGWKVNKIWLLSFHAPGQSLGDRPSL